VLEFMGLKNPLEMIHAVYRDSWERAKLATLAPIVLQLASAGDEIARGIVTREADELARTTAGAARKLDLLGARVPLALTGGAILNDEDYREIFLNCLRTHGVEPDPVALVDEPAIGAVRVARRLLP